MYRTSPPYRVARLRAKPGTLPPAVGRSVTMYSPGIASAVAWIGLGSVCAPLTPTGANDAAIAAHSATALTTATRTVRLPLTLSPFGRDESTLLDHRHEPRLA